MDDPAAALGGRTRLLRPAELTPEQKQTYDLVSTTMVPWAAAAGFQSRTEDGRLIGPFNVILHSPAIGSAFLALQAAEQRHTTLSERVRQVVILTVGAVWGCAYELYAHAAVARQAGLPDAAVAALRAGEPASELRPEEQLAQRVAREITAQRRLGDPLYGEAHATFGPQGLVDLLFLAGCYHTVALLLNTFEIPAPREPGADTQPGG